MTELVRRVHDLLTQQSTVKRKSWFWGARLQTLADAPRPGPDVREWIAGGSTTSHRTT
jgi:hypothetical protein